jgi:hypothetical protein
VTDRTVSIAILGNDAFRAARPATGVQFLHAALAAGFDAVVPASLGDELVAEEVLRLAQTRGRQPVVQCSCPFASAQLCGASTQLDAVTIPVASPPVALARALRLEQPKLHVTYIGACPGALDESIDLRVTPDAFLRGLAARGIQPIEQPEAFDDRLPPDRRRHYSLPGGLPEASLVERILRRTPTLVEPRADPRLSIADALLAGGPTLLDPAAAYGCVCAGAGTGAPLAEARAELIAAEPPRSLLPVITAPATLDLRPVIDTPASITERPPLDTVVSASAPGAGADVASGVSSSRRAFAVGVRTARRRQAAATQPLTEEQVEARIATPEEARRAQPIEREVPLDRPSMLADLLSELDDSLPPTALRAPMPELEA